MSTKRPPVCFNILSQTLFVFLLLFKEEAAYSDVPLGDQAVECCLSVSNHPVPQRLLIGYREQLKEQGCSIDAVLFRTTKNRVLCAPPDDPWVKERRNWLDEELKKCQENGFKGKRCQAMKPTSA